MYTFLNCHYVFTVTWVMPTGHLLGNSYLFCSCPSAQLSCGFLEKSWGLPGNLKDNSWHLLGFAVFTFTNQTLLSITKVILGIDPTNPCCWEKLVLTLWIISPSLLSQWVVTANIKRGMISSLWMTVAVWLCVPPCKFQSKSRELLVCPSFKLHI